MKFKIPYILCKMFRLTILQIVFGVGFGVPFLKSHGINGRIVGGQDTTIDLHPWQVSLQHKNRHFCGGILIAPTWVLTAAHYITEYYNSDLSIRAGSTNHSSGGQSIALSKTIIHKKDSILNDHDIAALQLAAPVTISTTKAATLSDIGFIIEDNTFITVTGWGALFEYGPYTDILQEVQVPVINMDDCRAAYGNSSVTNNLFCAGYLERGGQDSCLGDAGGPATIDNVVVGLVSWGAGCAESYHPGVYLRISTHREWIIDVCGV